MAEEFVYNDDLVLNQEKREELKRDYPRVWFALGQPGAGEVFDKVDKVAKQEKTNFRNYGFMAVCLATLALVLASMEPALRSYFPKNVEWPGQVLALVASAVGLLSVAIGMAGMGISVRKRQWLQNRLLAERLRQWQWQYFVANIPAMLEAAKSEAGMEAFRVARATAFADFHRRYSRNVGGRLNEILGEGRTLLTKTWIAPDQGKSAAAVGQWLARKEPIVGDERVILDELFRAYDSERFGGQMDYVGYMLGDGPFNTHSVTQRATLQGIGRNIVLVIVGVHVLVIAGIATGRMDLTAPAVLTMTLALIALAARVIEDGLRPTEQITRLQGYLSVMATARGRFTSGDDGQKVAAMIALEEAAAVEMIDFLREGHHARFVM